jgi:hypothetical protein
MAKTPGTKRPGNGGRKTSGVAQPSTKGLGGKQTPKNL